MAGIFVVFEGIDGSGKGTMLSLAAKWLFSIEYDNVLLTREPTYSGAGKQIRSALSNSSTGT